MKKRVKHESLLNTLARSVGRAAGTIAKATQGFAEDAAAIVKTAQPETEDRHKSRRAPARTPRRASRRKPKATRSATRRSRTRG
jgi:hypothetical protein